MAQSQESGDNGSPQVMNQAMSCQLSGVSEEWEIDELDCADELREAIEAVRDDHELEPTIKTSPWLLEPYWNEKNRRGPSGGVRAQQHLRFGRW